MSRKQVLSLLVSVIASSVLLSARPARAFTACSANAGSGLSGHWPDSRNTSNFGTQKWDFDWQISNEGLEVDNVKYTSDLSQAKKMVLRRASIPFLPVHYPENAATCSGPAHGYDDTLTSGAVSTPLCCAHVPTTVCNVPDRAAACNPDTQPITSCPAGADSCIGVCLGTQVDTSPPLEDGIGEIVSGASDADVTLTTQFQLGGYIFEQRWRFQDNGTAIPSMRLGGIHNCQLHTHQIYFRFNFELGTNGPGTEVVEQCGPGGCPDLTSGGGWTTLSPTCANRPSANTEWRMTDTTAAGRVAILQTGANEVSPTSFCDGTTTECGAGGCVNARDFCALPASEPRETFTTDNCNDHLEDAITGGATSDFSFWYLSHVEHHDPCSFLPMCDPALGTIAFGPTIRLAGAW